MHPILPPRAHCRWIEGADRNQAAPVVRLLHRPHPPRVWYPFLRHRLHADEFGDCLLRLRSRPPSAPGQSRRRIFHCQHAPRSLSLSLSTHKHKHTRTNTHIYDTYIHTYIHRIYIHTHTYTHKHTYIHTYTHTHTHTHTHAHTHTHTHTHTYRHTGMDRRDTGRRSLRGCRVWQRGV